MKSDGSLKSLLQGVSQQPTRDRLPGQCTEQVNMSADPVKGLARRPGDDLVAVLSTTPALAFGNFQTQDGNQFLVKITATGPEFYDYNGVRYPCALTDSAMTYWSTAGRWSVATMKERTYLGNTSIITKMTAAQYTNWGQPRYARDYDGVLTGQAAGIIQVLGGNYGKTYIIQINGGTYASFQTANGSVSTDALLIDTKYIALQLASQLVTNLGTGWGISAVGNLIIIIGPAGSGQFTMTATDGVSNLNMKAMTTSVNAESDLPKWAPEGYTVRVAKAADPEEDVWYRFKTDAGYSVGAGFGTSGAWYETTKPGLLTHIDPKTMPRVITWDPTTATFTCKQETWSDRTVGTDTTNPTPSFIGYGINDMTTFQSRLAVLAGPNMIMSKSKASYNFWVGSAATLVDTDPIDITAQAAFASTLHYMVMQNKDMVIFSPKGQFVLTGTQAATPSNAALALTTSFEADLKSKPVACGRNVFFSTKYGRFTGIREFYTEGSTGINDTRSITAHVNEYLRGEAIVLTATSNYDLLMVHTNNSRETIYPYQFTWSDDQKIQSAWSKWVFNYPITFSWFDNEIIYLIQSVDGVDYMLRLSLDVLPQSGLDYHLHISNRFDVTGVERGFYLPFDYLATQDLILVQGSDCPNPGLPVRITSIEEDTVDGGFIVWMHDDMAGGSIIGGVGYMSEYEPTMPRMKDSDGVVISDARLQIDRFMITTQETGEIRGMKKTQWGNGAEVTFEGYQINSPDSVVGEAALTDFVFNMPFKERADRGDITLYTSSHWPMTILDIEWSGTLNKRGRRLTQGTT